MILNYVYTWYVINRSDCIQQLDGSCSGVVVNGAPFKCSIWGIADCLLCHLFAVYVDHEQTKAMTLMLVVHVLAFSFFMLGVVVAAPADGTCDRGISSCG